MRKRNALILIVCAVAVSAVTVGFFVRNRPPEILNELLIGDWDRIDFQGVVPINWRLFRSDGTTMVRYGDVAYVGTFQFTNPNTIEVTYRNPPNKEIWTFTVTNSQLTMTSMDHGWIMAYKRVPSGSLNGGPPLVVP